MPEPFGDYHDHYRSLNAGAHRKAGIEVDTPSVTRHIGFWFPPRDTPFDVDGLPLLSVRQNGAFVDGFAKAIYAVLSTRERFETNVHVHCQDLRRPGTCDDVVVLFGGAFIFENGQWADQPIASSPLIKDAFESDNRILTMKALWSGLWVQVRFDFHSEYFTLTVFLTVPDLDPVEPTAAKLSASLSTLPALAGGLVPGADPGINARIRQSHRFVYHDIWDLFLADVVGARLAGSMKIFADFRGIVLAGHEGQVDGGGTLDLETFKNKGDTGVRFPRDWATQKLIPKLWPYLVCECDLDMRHREFTVSYMLRRRAVYMTALGPQPTSDPVRQHRPLHYIMVARPANDWQLGNLLDRLHFMGTVRLAALMELSALRTAGADLKAVEHVADKARDALHAGQLDVARGQIEQMKRLISHRDKDQKPLFWSGLQFRVERSRYYASRFRTNQKFLRIERIEGYEPYNQFIESRLGNVYDYIDRLGTRHERAQTSATDLLQDLQSAQAKIQNKQTRNLIEEIESIQFKAELALLAIILPYYSIAVFRDIFSAIRCCREFEGQIFLTIGLFFPALALLNFFWYLRQRDIHRVAAVLAQAFVFVVFASMIGVTIFSFLRTNGIGSVPASSERGHANTPEVP